MFSAKTYDVKVSVRGYHNFSIEINQDDPEEIVEEIDVKILDMYCDADYGELEDTEFYISSCDEKDHNKYDVSIVVEGKYNTQVTVGNDDELSEAIDNAVNRANFGPIKNIIDYSTVSCDDVTSDILADIAYERRVEEEMLYDL